MRNKVLVRVWKVSPMIEVQMRGRNDIVGAEGRDMSLQIFRDGFDFLFGFAIQYFNIFVVLGAEGVLAEIQ